MSTTRIPLPAAWANNRSELDDRLDTSLAESGLNVRIVNCLEDQGIFTVRQLVACTPKRLLEIPNIGEKTLKMICAALAKLGLHRQPACRAALSRQT